MLSTKRALNFCYFPLSFLTPSHHFLFKSQHCNSQQNIKVSKFRDEGCDEFLPWLENKAGMQISNLLSIGKSDYGRSLFACKNIQDGDCLLKVPYTVQISPDNVLPEIKPLLADVVGTVAKLAIVVLVEQKKGQNSEWAPYITRLPQQGELHSPIFWSEEELQMLQQSSLYAETINHKAKITESYLAIKPIFDRFTEFFVDVEFERFKHAYGLVASRAWGSTKGQSLIPFADFLNHDGTSESVVLNDEKEQLSEVIADRDYAEGEEVFIRYGKFPNSTLLLDFGFTVPCNIYDQVCFQIDIPYNDHLREMKLDLLQKHCFPKTNDVNFSQTGVAFVIKEVQSVQSVRGKGKGIPQSLRAFARVLCCTTTQELNDLAVEASQHDGRLARFPLVDKSLEIQAHEILHLRIDELIEKYCVSIQSLNVLEVTSQKFAIRRKMALDLLIGEVRVLRSASAWLKNYCQSYQEQGKTILKF